MTEMNASLYKEKMGVFITNLFILARTCKDKDVASRIIYNTSNIQNLLVDMLISLDNASEEIIGYMEYRSNLDHQHHLFSDQLLKSIKEGKHPNKENIDAYSKFTEKAYDDSIQDSYRLIDIAYKLK